MHSLIRKLHNELVFDRRTEVLSHHLSAVLPGEADILDVGCGDGTIDRLLMNQRPELRITGIDVMLRPRRHIEVSAFDGSRIPFADKHFDYVMFVDVLHHTTDAPALLREAVRVSRHGVIIKDHLCANVTDEYVLRFMDWVGNAPHGVVLPYRYFSSIEWQSAFEQAGLVVSEWRSELRLYPFPASLLFDRKLHFVARCGLSDCCPDS